MSKEFRESFSDININSPFLPDTGRNHYDCSHHLDEATISAFLSEKLGEPEQSIVKGMIENCPYCQEKARRIAEDFRLLEEDELLKLMREEDQDEF